ncbi:hypothetical protein CYMTET_46141 [Cymbomonas tetramitiformis]|uniref:Uncharacterized protein n=1 Tax=Cymbomonas tetramitiformis TaxID=36881 RepID=A0AAE0EYZ9_9CHLO|nr:hypothetical protein CYMTET_46141 [Cymbomonas tetramitiformis]
MTKAQEAKRAKAESNASPEKKPANKKAINKVKKEVAEAGPSKSKKRKSDVVPTQHDTSEEESELEDYDLYVDDNIADAEGNWPEHWDDCGPPKFAEWREHGPWVTMHEMNVERALRRQTQKSPLLLRAKVLSKRV